MKWLLNMMMFIIIYIVSVCNVAASNIIIFISFSMPKESIKQWIYQGSVIEAPIVIRGLVNNSFKDTINYIQQLNQDNSAGVQLDPTLFQLYQINRVPAVVVTNQTNCLPTQSCSETYDLIYGDVSLAYALKTIALKNDTVSSVANNAFNKLKAHHVY